MLPGGWPQIKLVTTKIMSSLLCIFHWRNVPLNFFTTLKYSAFFFTKYEPFELYHSKLYMEPSPPSVRGCMWQIWLWCGIITLRYDVTQLGAFWQAFFKVRYVMRRTQPARLLDAAEFSDTRSSPVEASRHPKFISNKSFIWPALLNLASTTNLKWPVLTHLWPNYC